MMRYSYAKFLVDSIPNILFRENILRTSHHAILNVFTESRIRILSIFCHMRYCNEGVWILHIHLSYCPKVERAVIEADVREQIDYPRLAESYPYDDPDSILQLICDILCSTSESIKIGNEQIPASKVKERYRRLDFEHVTYVMDSLRETTTKIKNIRGYLLTALYYAPLTIGPYYAAAVRHDFG